MQYATMQCGSPQQWGNQSLANPADICTKDVPGGQKHDHLIGLLLHDLVD
jgi:hypothetical protein